MAVTQADFNRIWASTSPLTPYNFSNTNYLRGWNFVGSTPPARQMWDKYMNLADQKMQYLYNNYLPLAGGILSGYLQFSELDSRIISSRADRDGAVSIYGGGGYATGSYAAFYGINHDSNAGRFIIRAVTDGSKYKELQGRPDGTLTWGGQPIQTSSDKRLKTDFADVPADVLEAWGKVEWKQFKYIDDAERKGVNNCRWHTGLVAQDVKEVGEENHVDLLKYGILCHDVREAVEEEKDEDGNVVREASEAVDLWTVRYEEALAMEVIYLRNEIKKLREEIKALRSRT